MSNMHYIYKITNLINNKFYIGMRSCKCDILKDKYMGSSKAIGKDVKLNPEKYRKEILFFASDRHMLSFYESVFVSRAEVDDPECYNMKAGGLGGWPKQAFSDERRKKIADGQRGRVPSEVQRLKASESNKGKVRTEEMKAAMRISKSNISNETRRKISEGAKGNKSSVGRVLSEETRRKIGEKSRGRKWSDESCERFSILRTGKKMNKKKEVVNEHD